MWLRRITKEEAVKQFKYNLSCLFAVLPTEIEPEFYESTGKNPTKFIENEFDKSSEIYTVRFYPSLKSPTFYYMMQCSAISSIVRNIDVANYILQEINFANPINFNAEKHTITGVGVDINPHEFYYRERIYDTAIEIGLCLSLGGYRIYELLKELKTWAQRTYEGRRVAFSLIIDSSQSAPEPKVDFVRFLEKNHAAVFTDGITSCITLDRNGDVIEYYCADSILPNSKRKYPYAPFRLQNFCSQCDGDRVGIVLQANGDILLFRRNRLFCARIEGKWRIIDLTFAIHTLKSRLGGKKISILQDQSAQLFLSLLDVSFAHSGGCLAIINKEDEEAKKLYEKDNFQIPLIGYPSESMSKAEKDRFIKIQTLQRIIHRDKKFFSVNRKLRQEMMALDGATIIGSDGTILAVGSIIKVEGGSEEGGRLAAAKTLSYYGVAIKVSADGKITAFQDGEEILRIF